MKFDLSKYHKIFLRDYIVFEDGSIFTKSGYLLPTFRKFNKNGEQSGYNFIKLPNERYPRSVYRIVAKLFVENLCPEKFNTVDHLDGCRSNDHVSNLKWVNNHLNSINKKGTLNASFDNDIHLWRAYFTIKKKEYTVGYYRTFREAHIQSQKEKQKKYSELYKKYLTK